LISSGRAKGRIWRRCRGYGEGVENVLVGANTGGLEGLGRQLLILVGDHVHTGGEVVNVGLLTAQIEDADLGVGNTTVEARLGVRLEMRR
jgi:hypothetical protein